MVYFVMSFFLLIMNEYARKGLVLRKKNKKWNKKEYKSNWIATERADITKCKIIMYTQCSCKYTYNMFIYWICYECDLARSYWFNLVPICSCDPQLWFVNTFPYNEIIVWNKERDIHLFIITHFFLVLVYSPKSHMGIDVFWCVWSFFRLFWMQKMFVFNV